MPHKFWIPTRPYSVIDAVNRMCAATGSTRTAMLSAHANYNGHAVKVWWNNFRRYFIASYRWSGEVYLARGDFETCARAGKAQHDRGERGSVVRLEAATDEQAAAALALGYEPWSEEIEKAHDATWRTDRHDLVNDAISLDRHFHIGAIGLLVQASDATDYQARLDAVFAERRAARRK